MSEEPGTQPAGSAEPSFDAAHVEHAIEQFRGEQNIAMGVAAGAVAAILGAAAWAVVTVLTKYQIGWMAVGVGFLVGIAVRTFGKGLDRIFGIIGAVLALLGCALGNLLAVCGMIAAEQELAFGDVVSQLNLERINELMVATFSPMDLLFYGIAVYEGYKLSFRQLTQQDIAARITGAPSGNYGAHP